jgi:hypothetical protein
MLRKSATCAFGGWVTNILRNDNQGTFADSPHYKFKSHQGEQNEEKGTYYLQLDNLFEDEPVKYARRVRYDRTVLAGERDNLMGTATSAQISQ